MVLQTTQREFHIVAKEGFANPLQYATPKTTEPSSVGTQVIDDFSFANLQALAADVSLANHWLFLKIETGDTLGLLANELGVEDYHVLMAANGLTDDVIFAGAYLLIPVSEELASAYHPQPEPSSPDVAGEGFAALPERPVASDSSLASQNSQPYSFEQGVMANELTDENFWDQYSAEQVGRDVVASYVLMSASKPWTTVEYKTNWSLDLNGNALSMDEARRLGLVYDERKITTRPLGAPFAYTRAYDLATGLPKAQEVTVGGALNGSVKYYENGQWTAGGSLEGTTMERKAETAKMPRQRVSGSEPFVQGRTRTTVRSASLGTTGVGKSVTIDVSPAVYQEMREAVNHTYRTTGNIGAAENVAAEFLEKKGGAHIPLELRRALGRSMLPIAGTGVSIVIEKAGGTLISIVLYPLAPRNPELRAQAGRVLSTGAASWYALPETLTVGTVVTGLLVDVPGVSAAVYTSYGALDMVHDSASRLPVSAETRAWFGEKGLLHGQENSKMETSKEAAALFIGGGLYAAGKQHFNLYQPLYAAWYEMNTPQSVQTFVRATQKGGQVVLSQGQSLGQAGYQGVMNSRPVVAMGQAYNGGLQMVTTYGNAATNMASYYWNTAGAQFQTTFFQAGRTVMTPQTVQAVADAARNPNTQRVAQTAHPVVQKVVEVARDPRAPGTVVTLALTRQYIMAYLASLANEAKATMQAYYALAEGAITAEAALTRGVPAVVLAAVLGGYLYEIERFQNSKTAPRPLGFDEELDGVDGFLQERITHQNANIWYQPDFHPDTTVPGELVAYAGLTPQQTYRLQGILCTVDYAFKNPNEPDFTRFFAAVTNDNNQELLRKPGVWKLVYNFMLTYFANYYFAVRPVSGDSGNFASNPEVIARGEIVGPQVEFALESFAKMFKDVEGVPLETEDATIPLVG